MHSVPQPPACKLVVIGVPLNEAGKLSFEAIAALENAAVIVGESRKVTDRFLKQVPSRLPNCELYFLDPFREQEWKALQKTLSRLPAGAAVCLLSDTGMPILFDPGRELLEFCRMKGFQILTVPGPTSWGAACAVSGFPPPFFVFGFLSQKSDERREQLQRLKSIPAHVVLMDTPYRFHSLLELLKVSLGNRSEVFLSWEISKSEERCFWGTLEELVQYANAHHLEKGEFVLILKKKE